MEAALDIGGVWDTWDKAPSEEVVFSTFTAQNILLPRNFILTRSLVCFQFVFRGNVFLICICMTEFYEERDLCPDITLF